MDKKRQDLVIAQITPINTWVKKFRFTSADPEKPLAPFAAGQYLNLFYEVDGGTTSRPYSIASSPKDAQDGFYELYIHGGGPYTSAWLFANAKVGMPIQSSIPEGEFCYRPQRDGKKVIGISGGMSVTPLYAMAKAVVDGTLDMELTLFCGWDSSEEVLYYEEFAAFAAQCPRFRAVFVLATEEKPGYEKGFVSLDMIKRYTDPTDATFFMCGPAEMYATLDRELASLQTPAERYHQEVPGEVKYGAPGTERIQAQAQYTLKLCRGGESYTVPMRGDETVLVALERAGLHPEARCRSGCCGYCGAKLESGSVFTPEHWKKQERKEEVGVIHVCCSFPLSDLEIVL